jgi:hypothetical protein
MHKQMNEALCNAATHGHGKSGKKQYDHMAFYIFIQNCGFFINLGYSFWFHSIVGKNIN